jgi:hypothetical protein
LVGASAPRRSCRCPRIPAAACIRAGRKRVLGNASTGKPSSSLIALSTNPPERAVASSRPLAQGLRVDAIPRGTDSASRRPPRARSSGEHDEEPQEPRAHGLRTPSQRRQRVSPERALRLERDRPPVHDASMDSAAELSSEPLIATPMEIDVPTPCATADLQIRLHDAVTQREAHHAHACRPTDAREVDRGASVAAEENGRTASIAGQKGQAKVAPNPRTLRRRFEDQGRRRAAHLLASVDEVLHSALHDRRRRLRSAEPSRVRRRHAREEERTRGDDGDEYCPIHAAQETVPHAPDRR